MATKQKTTPKSNPFAAQKKRQWNTLKAAVLNMYNGSAQLPKKVREFLDGFYPADKNMQGYLKRTVSTKKK